MQFWENLSPKHRRYAVILTVVLGFSAVIAFLPSGDDSKRGKKEDPAVRAVLTDNEQDNMRVARLLAQMENMRKDNQGLLKEVQRVKRDMSRMESGQMGPEMTRQLEEMNEQIAALQQQKQSQSQDADEENTEIVLGGEEKQASAKNPVDEPSETQGQTPVINEPAAPIVPDEQKMWDQPPAPAPQPDNGRGSKSKKDGEEGADQGPIRVIEAASAEKSADGSGSTNAEGEQGVYIPSGSIITGTLLTGMDAPTGAGAREEPFPALLRIKREAILPNRFRADVRECFVIVGGFGDISSERAYLRGETISCVRKDGKVIESDIESYTVGEDGKAGLRGRLVSKQGQMLAKAMMAGVMDGFASAFGKAPVPSLSLDDSEQQLYKQAFSGDAVQSGAVTGVGKALDRMAQFYIKQADGMYPVIEIDAGREVEIVMIRGGKLALK